MTRPITRVGHIAYGRNRFCGADVFGKLAYEVAIPSDLIVRAFGGRRLDTADREVLRCVALAVTSTDARVWPLKLARILASHGNLYAGFHGAQLANATDRMGPNAGTGAALALAAISDAVGAAHDDASVIEAAAHRLVEAQAVIGGFGVPFRDEDERLVELAKLLECHPITRRRAWRMYRGLAAAVYARSKVRANVVAALAAIAIDFEIAPHRVGLFITIAMSHTFAAHALEACDHDGELLRELAVEHVEYRGQPPRVSRR